MKGLVEIIEIHIEVYAQALITPMRETEKRIETVKSHVNCMGTISIESSPLAG
jgi:hypothetical protein